MFTWSYYEFKETVQFPGIGPLTRADINKYKSVTETAYGLVFHCQNDEVRFVPWGNVRYAGGVIMPQIVPDNVTPIVPAKKSPKK